MQWKGRLEGGRKYELPVSSLDIFPTALAAAGADDLSQYRLDGVNLLPYLEGEKQGAPHDYLFWRSGPNAAVRKGPWKLLMSGADLRRLYNVDGDPGESKDLSSERPRLVEEMKQAFDRWSADKAEPREGSRKVKTGLAPQHSLQFLHSTGVSCISIVLDLEKVLPMCLA